MCLDTYCHASEPEFDAQTHVIREGNHLPDLHMHVHTYTHI